MRILRWGLLALCLAGVGMVRLAAQESAPAQQAYHLPQDKLAKAIELNRIRDVEHFVDAFWGIAVLWLLLATRAAARMEAWALRVAKKRWIQGLAFFTALIVVLT